MKRIAFLICLLAATALTAFATPTTVDVNWDVFGGSAPLEIVFQNGDDSIGSLVTLGAHFYGTFHAEDADNNPYNYQVDNGLFEARAGVDGGGIISFNVERTDTKATSYGPAGQVSQSEVWTLDGVAYLARRTTTNYASAMNNNYGFQSNDQYQAAGTVYGISHSIQSGDGDGVAIGVTGSGAGILTVMSDSMGGNGFVGGAGLGCYENSDFEATGSGQYQMTAIAANYLAGVGWVAPGGGAYFENLIFNSGADIDDINTVGN